LISGFVQKYSNYNNIHRQITITIMTTEHDTQQAAVQRYLEFEAALTPVSINRLVKSGAMTLTHADELKSAYRKRQARKHARNFQAKKRNKEIITLRQTEGALVSDIVAWQQVVLDAQIQMDAAVQHYAQVGSKLSTQVEYLGAVRRRIAKLQAKTTPSANVPSPAANTVTTQKKTLRKRTPYNMFVKLHSAQIWSELGDVDKVRGATMKEAGKRWKALSSDERTSYKTAADQHNAKMAADQQQNQQATTT
jgi:hypothetical protein